ncbi:MAG TPA: hypothetical protein VFE50_17415 [Cyclobacteriaceae bacterium]|nr:hypothetical protein [Cyclobacteriaceae bacterium]
MKRLVLLICVLASYACKETAVPPVQTTYLPGEQDAMKIATVVAKSMRNASFREFLKTKAVQKFDLDYDVLLMTVLAEKVEPGKTFLDILKLNAGGVDIEKLLRDQPLLNIYVPGAPTWNTTQDVPWVAIANIVEDGKVRLIDSNESLMRAAIDMRPGVPVVVLKYNERVGVSYKNGVLSYDFLNKNMSSQSTGMESHLPFDQKVIDAFKNNCAQCYDRDFIYDGDRYSEAITSVSFQNDAAFRSLFSDWTEGDLELYFNVTYGGNAGVVVYASPGMMSDGKTWYLSRPLMLTPWQVEATGEAWRISVNEYDPGLSKGLGEAILSWSDPVITSQTGNSYNVHTLSTGAIVFSVEPVRIP